MLHPHALHGPARRRACTLGGGRRLRVGVSSGRALPRAYQTAKRVRARGQNTRLVARKISDPYCIDDGRHRAVTQRVKVRTSVCLVPEGDPIMLGQRPPAVFKLAAVCAARGSSSESAHHWSTEELRDHSIEHKDRWRIRPRNGCLRCRKIRGSGSQSLSRTESTSTPCTAGQKPVQPAGGDHQCLMISPRPVQ